MPGEAADRRDRFGERFATSSGIGIASDHTMSMKRANIVGALFFPVAALVTLLPFALLWGWRALWDPLLPWIFVPALIAGAVAHEALHALGFLLGGASRADLHFGIDRETMSPYAGCTAPLSAAAYRFSVALPGILVGLLPALLGIWWDNALAVFVGWFFLGAAGGDVAALWAMRSVPGGALVLDHPERVGCHVLAGENPPRR